MDNAITIDQIIDIPTAAREAGISQNYLRTLVWSGKIESVKIGRAVLVMRDSLAQYQESHKKIELPEGHLTPGQAAKQIGVSVTTIQYWISSGYLPASSYQFGDKTRWLINETDLEGKTRRPSGRRPKQTTDA